MTRQNDSTQLTPLERTRYSRHLILPEVKMEGQLRLKAARVLVVGAGGLGSPASMYLAAAGIGTIGLVDFDLVDLSNLQRQILHSTETVGELKLVSAAARLHEINPEVRVVPHAVRLDASNALEIIKDYDIVLDGTDNFATRYLVNDACVILNKPNVYGSIYRFEGQASVFSHLGGPCYRCLFPDPPPPDAVPNCAEGGVLGVLAGTIGVLQATEAIKLILRLGTGLAGRLLLYDAVEMRFDTLNISRDKNCPLCGDNPKIKTLMDTAVSCAAVTNIAATDLQKRIESGSGPFLLDVRNAEEYRLCKIEGSTLIPLPELERRINELDAGAEIVVYCKSGARSQRAAELLIGRGFKNVQNLQGGILDYIATVAPEMQSY